MENIIGALLYKYKNLLTESTKRIEEIRKEYKNKDIIDIFMITEQIGMIRYFIHDLQNLQKINQLLSMEDKNKGGNHD